MKKLFLFMLCLPFLMASTCENEDDQIVCTLQFVYGLNVVVLDATSGQPLVEGVLVKAVDGPYQDCPACAGERHRPKVVRTQANPAGQHHPA